MTKKTSPSLLHKRTNTWKSYTKAQHKAVFKFNEEYKQFLAQAKTERMCYAQVLTHLKKAGFKDIATVKKAKKYDKLYKTFKNKAIMAFIVGTNPNEFRVIGSHMDSPRLDLKPLPLVEEAGLGVIKTHYYGGVKKFQWVNQPLALHGVAFTKKGKKIDVHIGDGKDDPVFAIPDLLIHLSRQQFEKTANKIIEGEELNIVVGNIPLEEKDVKDEIKNALLTHLHNEYGLIEEDFAVAELQLVPAGTPRDVGFDRSIVGAYGHDDKVCVYTSLRALLEVKKPKLTAVGLFVDKEEIGSMGDTGAASLILENFAHDYKELTGINIKINTLFEHSKSISADVTSGLNPNHKGVQDPTNCSYLGQGVSIEKYGGGGGKYSTNDAHAEYMSFLRMLCDKNNIAWQTGENGKVDVGGGGTIAMYMSRYGMDCVDIGPCVLAMHAPMELVSKADVYSAYKLYTAFFQ